VLSEPRIITREPQPYAAIPITVEQSQISEKAPPLVGEILGWIGKNGEQVGPAYFNYARMYGSKMDMEVGAPTKTRLKGDGRVATGVLPGGRYVWATYTGHYSGLRDAHEQVHQWLAKQPGLKPFDMEGGGLTLLEIYETDPEEVPDPANWITHIAFRLGD
jgi:effector-binding domain-containing protein